MKKLFATVLALCLLCCSFALAEEAPELSWEDTLSNNPDLAANDSDQTIAIDDVGTILYWVPGNLPAIDVNQFEADEKPLAAFSEKPVATIEWE